MKIQYIRKAVSYFSSKNNLIKNSFVKIVFDNLLDIPFVIIKISIVIHWHAKSHGKAVCKDNCRWCHHNLTSWKYWLVYSWQDDMNYWSSQNEWKWVPDGWDIPFLKLWGHLTSLNLQCVLGILYGELWILNDCDQRCLAIIFCSNRQVTLSIQKVLDPVS